MSLILGIDTSNGIAQCCVYNPKNEQYIARSQQADHGIAEVIIPQIQSCLDEYGADFSNLTQIITTRGPGSFTGIRVGITVAKTLAMALSIPMHGLSSLQSCVWNYVAQNDVSADDIILCLLDSKRQSFFAQTYNDKGNVLGSPHVMEIDDVLFLLSSYKDQNQCHLIGNVDEIIKKELQYSGFSNIKIEHMKTGISPAAFYRFTKDDDAGFQGDIEPLYLRDADTSTPKAKQRHLEKIK